MTFWCISLSMANMLIGLQNASLKLSLCAKNVWCSGRTPTMLLNVISAKFPPQLRSHCLRFPSSKALSGQRSSMTHSCTTLPWRVSIPCIPYKDGQVILQVGDVYSCSKRIACQHCLGLIWLQGSAFPFGPQEAWTQSHACENTRDVRANWYTNSRMLLVGRGR